ncbi:hypothetical protein ACF06Q_03640 [Streptomyces leeuwenhoekii]|uniref:hypothetical protein n=1 Tax=Streptomyces leeuwenhoekii TaxID=1437453 RepID=UPI0036F6F80D
MTTDSSVPRSNEYDISPWDAPSAETAATTGVHPVAGADTQAARAPAAGAATRRMPVVQAPVRRAAPPQELARRPYGDPVGDLVRAAVADRPLEEVVDLITMLERSPDYAHATADALRAVGVNRSVEDVTRLVALLTRPPRHPDSADEAIRAAAACRPVEDVSRLMELLNRTPLEAHCGQEAVRAAATARPVEDLVELIGRLAAERRARTAWLEEPEEPQEPHEPEEPEEPEEDLPPLYGEDVPPDDTGHGPRTGEPAAEPTAERTAPEDRAPRERRPAPRRLRTGRGRAPRPPRASAPSWPHRLAAAVLAACGAAFFPLYSDGVAPRAYGLALGMSALALVVALLLILRPALPVLAAAVVVPAGMAAAGLYAHAFPSGWPARVMDLTLASVWTAVPLAVGASLVALTALCLRVAARLRAGREPAAGRRAAAARAGTRRPAD